MRNNNPVSRSLFPPRVVSHLTESLLGNSTFQDKDSFIVFVCGAQTKKGIKTARDTFLAYAKQHWSQLHFFQAEDALEALQHPGKSEDMLTYENKLALYADCILMLLESPGTLAELGAFAQDSELVKILLAVNDLQFREQKSFISEGPLEKISQQSKFGDVIYANFASSLTVASIVEERLKKGKRKIGLRLTDIKDKIDKASKQRLLLLLDLIGIFFPLSHRELIVLLKNIFGERSYDIHTELSLLAAMNLISRLPSGFYTRTLEHRGLFLRFDGKPAYSGLRSWVVAHYHKYDRERFKVLSALEQ